jgi:hypothetical protein
MIRTSTWWWTTLAAVVVPIEKRTPIPADLETVIVDLLHGQYNNPVRVVAFNTFEGWSQDVSEDIAQVLRRRCDLQLRDVPSNIQDFVAKHEGYGGRQLTLRLAT